MVTAALFKLCLGMVSCTPNGIYHTVQPGQTLYRIAKVYEIDETELARVNNISDPRKLQSGQRIYIPGVDRPRRVSSYPAQTSYQTSASQKKSSTQQQEAVSTFQGNKDLQDKDRLTEQQESQKSVKGIFDWPLEGTILKKFGAHSDAPHRGIEIGAPLGTPITASASGKVIYSGNAIRGYGNLIILEHNDDYFTVYGYNHLNLVKMNDFVGQGDKIATVGKPPNGESPRLHFEIRRGKSAVNPIFFLP
ncbi:MAG: peptidoglycan DD-metalloendopeptidase family protein [Deltaproteobacteria bacterium]|nr:peptidoglycan DD-metalloendopeptidase family protein [Deltaproteobacteria bacterium]